MDFSAVCRTCLGPDALSPIFVGNVDHRRHAAAVFIATGIKVELNDGLPQHICATCTSYINSSLKFRTQCKESESKLLRYRNNFSDLSKAQVTDNETENCETLVEDLKLEYDILKIEFKCEFEVTDETGSVKCEDLDVENDTPLSNENEISDVSNEVQSVKEKENQNHNKKTKVQRVSCSICGKDLSARSLRAHMAARHASAGGLRCAYCKLELGSKDAITAHAAKCPGKKKRRVRESGRELVSCELCHKSMQRNSLRAHQAVKHKGLGPVCEHCGRRFGNRLRLSEHLRAKHGHAKLQCAQCDFKSSSSSALQNHERRHRGEKPFVCETCGAKFHAAYLLAQHRHSHRTEKRVKCGQCGALFKSQNSLHTHRAARHGARRYRCHLCARVYSCRHYAVKHLRSVHGFKGTVPQLQVDPAPA